MKRVAFVTLGCKVNQYDTQAMRELFLAKGYQEVPFSDPADVYVVNTCTVTGTGDKKSRQMLRRAHARNPGAAIVVAGCLAQRQAEEVLLPGIMLVLGTGRRREVVQLLEEALAAGAPRIAVQDYQGEGEAAFEPLSVEKHAEHTRAVLKIQEGCDGRCSYCIIPSVRGPIRSSPLADIRAQAEKLAASGYQEVVLTGIHLSSYGRDLAPARTLLDAIDALHGQPGISRIRLGSLEPRVVTEEFAEALAKKEKVCPQFHLSLQSGSDAVLRAMRRRYTVAQYLQACEALREAYPLAALTTDVMCGFPGEGEAELAETMDTMRRAAFARVHVFPYSERAGTPAAVMEPVVPRAERERRARLLIALGAELQQDFLRGLLGRTFPVLIEEVDEAGDGWGYTPQYARVRTPGARPGAIVPVRMLRVDGENLLGEREEEAYEG